MKIRASIAKKEGTPGYGSNMASLEIEFSAPDNCFTDHALLQTHAEAAYASLEKIVDARLAAMRPADPPTQQEREECERSDYVPRRQRQSEPPPPPPERREYPTAHTNNGKPWRGSGPPLNGRELLGWARRKGKDRDLLELGKSWNLADRVLDWTADEVQDVFDRLNQAPVNGHTNGRPAD